MIRRWQIEPRPGAGEVEWEDFLQGVVAAAYHAFYSGGGFTLMQNREPGAIEGEAFTTRGIVEWRSHPRTTLAEEDTTPVVPEPAQEPVFESQQVDPEALAQALAAAGLVAVPASEAPAPRAPETPPAPVTSPPIAPPAPPAPASLEAQGAAAASAMMDRLGSAATAAQAAEVREVPVASVVVDSTEMPEEDDSAIDLQLARANGGQ